MCKQEGVEPEIPKGYHKLKKLHDQIVEKMNAELLEYTSKETVVFPKDVKFEKTWRARKLKFKRITNAYDLRLAGVRQNHCIGSYYDDLFKMGVYSFTYKGREYNIAFNSETGGLTQFRGYRNCQAPIELQDLVLNDVKLKHTIIRKTDLPEHYPFTISREAIRDIQNKSRDIQFDPIEVNEEVHEGLPF
jgi:hypothetical protein